MKMHNTIGICAKKTMLLHFERKTNGGHGPHQQNINQGGRGIFSLFVELLADWHQT